ncbi:TPA: phenylalanine--tRNA ligase subunit beta [Candidatus Berkelbacteria bacterium]|uniref:Phenylalanine--tRNA ligase beta subunit n=1 Tax=Berkelbacteria bacterium GW2011_GWE1_39_12 TaxID=1618337 RepID=A0A0G4B5C3_9BACT|nr:MAG: phenylalanyl-tRNA synthetase, beta subunit [Berkelbacteria bacterium GW2011_GWE1_39_12]HBO60164.1 phenylalanine--tRNA ligase subunit beta [Candidatus Berkelbacteria bacterium]
MKILLSWLKDYVQFDKSADELAEDLSMFAHEVESIKKYGDDFVLDLEITPNRGDCLSHLGIARQISAMYDKSLNIPEIEIDDVELSKNIKVVIEKQSICPRFTARIIDNVSIKESPKWLQERITAYGFRPINNIVDITNYAMIDAGQPLHAFDYDKIKYGLMRIRLSKDGEKVTTLDGKERFLPSEAIIIEDEEKIFDLAGIMGGQASEVTNDTKTIVLVGSVFDPILIRRASKKLHHQTDASYRYERGVDFEGSVYGVNLAANLIKETAPDAAVGKLIDKKQVESDKQTVDFTYDQINRLIGTNLDKAAIDSYLTRLHFKVESDTVYVPSFRWYDVKIWQDLAEEVARVFGYNSISRNTPALATNITQNKEWMKRESAKDYLKEKGFTEVYATSFSNKDKIVLLGYNLENCVRIINPIAPETEFLRPSLSVSLLSAAAKNPWSPDLNIFEVAKVFDIKKEYWQIGILSAGKNTKTLQEIINGLNVKAQVAQVDQNILDAFKIRRPINMVIFNSDELPENNQEINYEVSQNKLRDISKFAPTIRDISIIVNADIESNEIEKAITAASSAVLFAEKFDEFVSDKFGLNKKSLAFHIWLQNKTDVVSESEANNEIDCIVKSLQASFKAEQRTQ